MNRRIQPAQLTARNTQPQQQEKNVITYTTSKDRFGGLNEIEESRKKEH